MNSYLQLCDGENHDVIRIHRCGWNVHFSPKYRNFNIIPEAMSLSPDHYTYVQVELLQIFKINVFYLILSPPPPPI